jgi:hypothetical protein
MTRTSRRSRTISWSASHRAQKILVILHGATARARRKGWIATNPCEKAETVTVKPSDDFDQSEAWSRRQGHVRRQRKSHDRPLVR